MAEAPYSAVPGAESGKGLPFTLIDTLPTHLDIDGEVENGCRILRISRRFSRSGNLAVHDRQILTQLERLAVIWSDTNDRVALPSPQPQLKIGLPGLPLA